MRQQLDVCCTPRVKFFGVREQILGVYYGHTSTNGTPVTMTNPNQLCDVLLFMCSKMADETNLSSKLPVADRTREI